ncbi:MAG: hypothetical protein LUI02_06245 [Clostridiales bacterium]|nr:hypothetical protein [Clostridiales bacterium]
MWRAKASFTVEAAFIVPLVIAVLALAMTTGLSMYTEVRDQSEQDNIANLWLVDDFYTGQKIEDLVGVFTNDQS